MAKGGSSDARNGSLSCLHFSIINDLWPFLDEEIYYFFFIPDFKLNLFQLHFANAT